MIGSTFSNARGRPSSMTIYARNGIEPGLIANASRSNSGQLLPRQISNTPGSRRKVLRASGVFKDRPATRFSPAPRAAFGQSAQDRVAAAEWRLDTSRQRRRFQPPRRTRWRPLPIQNRGTFGPVAAAGIGAGFPGGGARRGAR